MPKRAAAVANTKFAGFPRGAPQFLVELAAEMNREWFEANKPRYVELWVEPMTALVEELAVRLRTVYTPVKVGAPKLFRLHRDTRFSKDKSPYKTHVAAMIPAGKGQAAIYMHFGIEDEYVGAGTYFFEPPQLPRWRKLVAADKTGKDLAKLVAKLRASGYEVGGHDDYKRVPKPYPEDHPRAELLKLRGLTIGFPAIPRGMLHRRELADFLVDHAKHAAPLVVWLARNVK